MLEKFIEACIKNKFFVILLTLVIVGWGLWALLTTPIDAIPDLSDVQVIIYTDWMGQSPNEVEDQVTYPLSKAMLAVPRVKAVRGYSFFSVSFVYIIFEDGTNLYWARSRVLEYLNTLQGKLPTGITPVLGPDATGVGWVYQYTVEGKGYNLAELRAIQDWYIRYQLQSVPGVAEVASVGGFKKQYEVALDPNKLIAYNIPINTVMMAIKSSNRQIGASMLEMSETEFMVRGLGYFKNIEDIKNVVVSASPSGTPIQVRDIAYVYEAPEMRRGIAEKDGKGEAVGATVVMRHGKNALEVIKNVKKKLKEIEPGLPKGVKIVPVYDRTKLIYRAIDTLKQTLIEEIIVVALVCVVFLWHLRSAFVSIITLPLGILISLIIMRYQGLNANIMSLGGIAIAIGAMVDASIVMVENVHKKIEHEGERRRDLWEIIIESSKEVGPSLFFSLMIIAVSFMPVFTLQAQEGRLFRPLAFTKGYAMAAGAILAITLVPVLMGYLIRGKLKPEEKNPVNRFLIWVYRPIMYKVLKIRWAVVLLAIAALIATVYPLKRLGSEFMPPLNEGDILYMPNTAPGISVTQARQVLQLQDQILRQFPMVETVFGKMGRIETATDPAPLDMVETVVTLKPVEEWPKKKGGPFGLFSRPMTIEEIMDEMDAKLKIPGVGNIWIMPIKTRIDMLATGIKTPVGVKVYGSDMKQIIDLAIKIEDVLRKVPGTRNVFAERLMSGNYVDFEINREAAARYGLTVGDVQDVIESAIGGMPITTTVEGRARFPVSIRYARELRDDIEKLKRVLVPIAPMSGAMETRSSTMQMGGSMSMGSMSKMQGGTGGMGGAISPSMEMSPMKSMNPMSMTPMLPLPMSTQLSMGGSMGMGMSAPMSGSMGMSSSMPSSGSSAGSMGGSMGMMGGGMSMGGGISSMSTPMGSPLPPTSISPTSQLIQVPLGQLADIKVKKGPMAINSEGGLLRAIVFVDVATQDIGGYVDQAKKAVATSIKFPPGYYIGWSGQFEYMQRAAARLKLIVPITLAIIFILLYLNFRNMSEAMIVMLTLPFGVIGGIWLMYALKFNMSVAVGVGFIALAGLAAETAVIMLLFLDLSYKKLKASGEPITKEKLYDAVVEGAVMRVRPKMMTVMTTILGLVPIFWEQGIGSSVMRRLATPMVGGLVSSLILTLLVIPAIYAIWKGREIKRLATTAGEIPIVAPKAEGKPVKPEAEVKAESVKSEEEGEEVEIIGAAPKSRRRAIIIIALIAALALVALGVIISYKFIGGKGVQLNAPTQGGLSISLSTSNLKVGENQMKVKVLDASGKSVADAHVEVMAFMPAMPSMGMPEMRSQAEGQLQGDEYVATVNTPMAGDWEITVNVSTPETTGSEKFRMTAK